MPRVLATVPPPNWTGQLSHVHLGGPELALLAWEEGCPVAVLTALRLGIPLKQWIEPFRARSTARCYAHPGSCLLAQSPAQVATATEAAQVPRLLATVHLADWTGQLSHVQLGPRAELPLLARLEAPARYQASGCKAWGLVPCWLCFRSPAQVQKTSSHHRQER